MTPKDATKAQEAKALLHTEHGPGAAAAVLEDGATTFHYCAGYASLEHDIPISADTVFPVASITKTFTGIACLIAEHEGRLNRDDSIADYLPEFRHYGDVTIQHLLDMRSGLREILRVKDVAGNGTFDNRDRSDFIEAFQHIFSRNYAPGTRYSYANTNFILLAMLLERVYNKSYSAVLDDLFFQPLNMQNSYVIDAPWPSLSRLADCYLYDDQIGLYQRGTPKTPNAGGGNVYASLSDLCKWLGYLRNGCRGNFDFRPRITTPETMPNGQDGAYTNGFMCYRYNNMACCGHDGDWPGLKSALYYYPEADIGIVIIANSEDYPVYNALLGLADIYMETPKQQHTAPTPAFYDDLYCGPASGHYLKTYTQDNKHYVAFAGKPQIALSPDSQGKWKVAYGSRRLEIAFNGEQQLNVRWNGRDLTFYKATPSAIADIDTQALCDDYYNDELQIWHSIYARDDGLYLRMGGPWNSSHATAMQHISGDIFALGEDFALMFRRNDSGGITGYSLHDERLDDMRFTKSNRL